MNHPDRVEMNLKTFRPTTHRQFAAFNIASRFDDLPNLGRYLDACHHPVRTLLMTARLAEEAALSSGADRTSTFFDILTRHERKEAA